MKNKKKTKMYTVIAFNVVRLDLSTVDLCSSFCMWTPYSNVFAWCQANVAARIYMRRDAVIELSPETPPRHDVYGPGFFA